ncbi:MAG: UbiX family flavin prenyltransferase [Alphaproteobacteria bacterium]|nr:MAG: UbiX family flavin prenyltransferase [Alphaproteobacteria bacterium]
MRLIIAMSGATGLIYGIRLLEVLKPMPDVETHLIMSRTAKMNAVIETDWSVKDIEALADEVHSDKDLAASISSGSFTTDGMVVVPCSMKSLSGIANSYADTLIVRAADVVLKEHRRLVVVPRETPLHVGHCKLLYEAAQLGAIIVPPMPAFYNRPQTIDDIINHTVGRLLDLYGLDAGIVKRWSGAGGDKGSTASNDG